MSEDPAGVYRERSAEAGREAALLAGAIDRVVHLRLVVFLLAAACAGAAWWRGWPLLAVAAAAGLAGFGALVRRHGRLSARHRRAVLCQQISDEALLRLARDWEGLAANARPPEPPPDGHPYAADLDVTGRASLLRLLDTTTTPAGGAALTAGCSRPPSRPPSASARPRPGSWRACWTSGTSCSCGAGCAAAVAPIPSRSCAGPRPAGSRRAGGCCGRGPGWARRWPCCSRCCGWRACSRRRCGSPWSR